MNRSTTSRVLKGSALAGSDFVTNARAAWGLTFEELFTDPKPKRKKRSPLSRTRRDRTRKPAPCNGTGQAPTNRKESRCVESLPRKALDGAINDSGVFLRAVTGR